LVDTILTVQAGSLKMPSPDAYDGVAGDAGAALDLALGVARAQERPDRGL